MTRQTDLDESAARQATDLLLGQRAVYEEVLLELQGAETQPAVEPDRLREMAATAGRALQPLMRQTAALSALAARLRRPGCAGPRVDAARTLLAEVGTHAAETGARFDHLISVLRADQSRTLAEINDLERATPAAYHLPAAGPAILVDLTG